MCKKFYVEKLNKILNELAPDNKPIYEISNLNIYEIRESIRTTCQTKFKLRLEDNLELPFIHIIPKFHKQPIGFRSIIASSRAITKPLSVCLSKALKLIQKFLEKYCNAIEKNTGVRTFWIINDRNKITKALKQLSTENKAYTINTYDFENMYTNLRHEEINEKMHRAISIAFGKYKHIWINNNEAS